MKTNIISVLLLLSLLTLALTAGAQQKPYSEEITVVAPYQPKIADADKISVNPVIRDTADPKPRFSYAILSKPHPTVFVPEPIEAARMAGEPVTKLYENLLKAGFGNHVTPYAEYFFNSTRSKELAYGVHARHLSSAGKIEGYAFPGFSENRISTFVRQFRDRKYNLSGEAAWHRDVVHFYGFNPADFEPAPSKEDLRQRFSLFSLKGGLQSAKPDSGALGYHLRVAAYHLSDKYESGEFNLRIEGGIERSQPLLKFSRDQHWGIRGSVDYFNDRAAHRKASGRALLSLRPFIQGSRGPLTLRAGFNATVEADSTSYFRLYPDLEARASVIPGRLEAWAGVTGSVNRNSYLRFTTENPFVHPEIPLSFLNTRYRLYGGFSSDISGLFDLFFEISRSQLENQYFYVNLHPESDSLQNRFMLNYDDNCDKLDLKTSLAWQFMPRFRAAYTFHLHQFYTSEALPWHVSDFDMNLMLSYNIGNKLMIDITGYYYDRMYALTYNPDNTVKESKYLRDRMDISLGAEYRYTTMIGAFLRLNNLANTRYYAWNEYPVYRFNFLAGLSFSF